MALSKIKTGSIIDSAVTPAKIASDAVTPAKIADDAINSEHITDASIDNAHLGTDIDASKIATGTFANARISETSVTQHVTATDLTPVRQDILSLALHSAVADNKAAYNLTNSQIDQFEDATGVGTATDVSRNTISECYSSVGAGTQVNFTADGTWTRGSTTKLSHILLVAGGGGGGWDAGGGGGAGGLVYTTDYAVSGTSYAVDIGGGGAYSGSSSPGSNGEDTTFIGATTLTASGGGGGGSGASGVGSAGGSGGGSGGGYTAGYGAANQSSESGVSGTDGFGFDGVAGATDSSTGKGGGGGGGAGGTPASVWTTTQSSNGGAGKDMSAIFGTGVGDNGWFSGGAGAGSESVGATSYGNGGAGLYGGGARGGGPATGNPNATAAIANTGGGGGGGKNLATNGATGFLSLIPEVSNATGTLVSNANVPSSAQTKVSGVMLYKNASGTNTLGTDIKASFTCNGGSNWTEATSYTQATPEFSTGVKMVKLAETTCTSGSDVRWKVEWANQAGGSKVAELYGFGVNY